MEIIYDKHFKTRQIPKNLKPEDIELFAHEFHKEINETTLLKLSNVYILKDTIFSLRKLHFYLSHTHLHGLSRKSLLKRISMLFSKGDKIHEAVWIIDNWSYEYFHWLTDALPRLIASEKMLTQDYIVILPKQFEDYHYITETLKLLNCNMHFYNKRVFINKLILPSHTAPTGNFNKHVINILRNRFLINEKHSAKRDIFISREKANKRKITNEAEVRQLLKLYDYEVHFFEDYTFKEQVEIMSQTKSLIGLHGAGLTNMLFMPENGQLLELRNKYDAHNNCYFSLASDLNHNYYYQLNDGDSNDTYIANVTVNLKELKINLETMKKDR